MTEELTSSDDGGAPNRRRFIKTAGIGAAGVWAAPAVVSAATASAGASPLSGEKVLYSESFTQGQGYPAGSAQYNNWGAFRASLSGGSFVSVTISGSNDPVGLTCTDPTTATALAAALVGNYEYNAFCDGQRWNVGPCGDGPEINAGPNVGDCACWFGQHVVRPQIENANWGGIAGATCGAPSQTLTVCFERAPE